MTLRDKQETFKAGFAGLFRAKAGRGPVKRVSSLSDFGLDLS